LPTYSTASAGLLVNILTPSDNTGDAAGDTTLRSSAWLASNFGDVLRLGSSGVVYGARRANDHDLWRDGNDNAAGEAGTNHLIGGAGADALDGAGGNSLPTIRRHSPACWPTC
jgi:hypothetical protein